MATLERAIAIAAEAHAGQKDKGGAPYILHPLRVMMAVSPEDDRIVAVLHDVLEDTDIQPIALTVAGFSSRVVEALVCLTRQPDEKYDDFIARLKPNAIARRVKLADLADNSDLQRIAHPTQTDYARCEKYRRATLALTA
jgi:(p)ppGpp synthase/HD superfamily hydrolase